MQNLKFKDNKQLRLLCIGRRSGSNFKDSEKILKIISNVDQNRFNPEDDLPENITKNIKNDSEKLEKYMKAYKTKSWRKNY